MCTGNIPANFLENRYFKRFCEILRPSYKLFSRKPTFPKLLAEQKDEIELNVLDRIESAEFIALTSDGWTDVADNSLINVIVFCPEPFVYETVDASAVSHTGEYIAGLLREQILKLGPAKVTALVTDHASNMRTAWQHLESEFPWIVFTGCKAHMANLCGNDICKLAQCERILVVCRCIAKFYKYVSLK